MRAIGRYIMNMLPFMALVIPVYLPVRAAILKRRTKHINYYHEAALWLFVMFLAGLASQTVIPTFAWGADGFHMVQSGSHATILIPFRVFGYTYYDIVYRHDMTSLFINFLGNIVMFVPLGLFPPLLWRLSDKQTVAIGFCTSLFIETVQLWLPRWTDIDDLLLNTAGTILGLWLYHRLYRRHPNGMKRFSAS